MATSEAGNFIRALSFPFDGTCQDEPMRSGGSAPRLPTLSTGQPGCTAGKRLVGQTGVLLPAYDKHSVNPRSTLEPLPWVNRHATPQYGVGEGQGEESRISELPKGTAPRLHLLTGKKKGGQVCL